ncbi:hypothetical protein [Staphylococcus aureus]
MINTGGAGSWISLHEGGAVGMGYSVDGGMVVVGDG